MSPATSSRPRRYRVDGSTLETRAELPLRPEGDAPPRWVLDIDHAPSALDEERLEWRGDVRDGGRTWARFARLAQRRLVRMEGLFDLVVDLPERRARLHALPSPLTEGRLVRHALPYLAALDGRLVLHAAAVVLPEGAALLCGDARTGKSTLALALDARGLAVLGDDHVVLDVGPGGVRAHASLPTIDAAQASRRRFAPHAAAAPGKQPAACRAPRPSDPVSAHAMFFLRRGGSEAAVRVPPREVVRRLFGDVLFVGDPGDARETAQRLRQAADLARRLPAYELALPEGLDALASGLPRLVRVLRRPEAGPGPRTGTSRARLDVAAACWLAAARAAVSLLPLGRARRLMARLARIVPRPRRPARADPASIGRAVERGTRFVPRASCLVQALAAQALLLRHRHRSTLHLGARRQEGRGLAAHAWLECDGRIVAGDGPGAHTPLGRA